MSFIFIYLLVTKIMGICYYIKHHQYKTSFMKRLIGLQSINNDANKVGDTIGQNNVVYNILDFENYDWINDELIASSLSNQCRYVGNTGYFYSIAQHCVKGAESLMLMGHIYDAYQFLYHDASEAFIGDMTRPLKNLVRDQVDKIENQIMFMLGQRFNFPHDMSQLVKQMDKNLAQYEMSFMMDKTAPRDEFWSPEYAKNKWLYTKSVIVDLINFSNQSPVESDQNGFNQLTYK